MKHSSNSGLMFKKGAKLSRTMMALFCLPTQTKKKCFQRAFVKTDKEFFNRMQTAQQHKTTNANSTVNKKLPQWPIMVKCNSVVPQKKRKMKKKNPSQQAV